MERSLKAPKVTQLVSYGATVTIQVVGLRSLRAGIIPLLFLLRKMFSDIW